MKPALAATLAAIVVTTAAHAARADLSGDVGVAGGAMKRFMAQRLPGADDAGFGWTAQGRGHLKIGESLRVGVFVSYDRSPLGSTFVRHFIAAGPSVRFMPSSTGNVRYWLGVGLAYARAVSPAYSLLPPQTQSSSPPKPIDVEPAAGGFLEAPLSLGIGYMLKRPWMIEAELSGRFGFAHHGSLYDLDQGRAAAQGAAAVQVENPGLDRYAVGLTVGVSLQL